MSLACGHIRELADSALWKSSCGELVALDQDQESLAVVRGTYPDRVVPVCRPIRDYLSGQLDLGSFDLIYAAGLLDYLHDGALQRLLSASIDRLNPGGRLLVANFTPQIRDSGYMEAIMDWFLVYRTADELREFLRRLG